MAVAATLSARGDDGLTGSMRRHASECDRCRMELADHAAYRAAVTAVGQVEFVAPTRIVPRVMADVGPWVVPAPAPAVAHRPVTHRLRVAAAAIATAAATATAGTLVLVRMHRHRIA